MLPYNFGTSFERNAVPPMMAKGIALGIAKKLEQEAQIENDQLASGAVCPVQKTGT